MIGEFIGNYNWSHSSRASTALVTKGCQRRPSQLLNNQNQFIWPAGQPWSH